MPETERRDRLKEVEEIQRRILARLDASDKRAAERENPVAERNAEPRLNAEQEAWLKKWNETLDKFFEILEDMRRKLDRVN